MTDVTTPFRLQCTALPTTPTRARLQAAPGARR